MNKDVLEFIAEYKLNPQHFFDANGQEVVGTRVIGFQSPADFLASLQRAGH